MRSVSSLLKTAPRWHRSAFLPSGLISKAKLSWLYEEGSLTSRLKALFGKKFRVKLLKQSWGIPHPEEAALLGLPSGTRAIIREVALQNGKRPMILARSVIPERTLLGADPRLAHLGDQPLGHIIFADPRFERVGMQLTRIKKSAWQKDVEQELESNKAIWGRRSLYTLGPGYPLLVAEFFLPELLKY